MIESSVEIQEYSQPYSIDDIDDIRVEDCVLSIFCWKEPDFFFYKI